MCSQYSQRHKHLSTPTRLLWLYITQNKTKTSFGVTSFISVILILCSPSQNYFQDFLKNPNSVFTFHFLSNLFSVFYSQSSFKAPFIHWRVTFLLLLWCSEISRNTVNSVCTTRQYLRLHEIILMKTNIIQEDCCVINRFFILNCIKLKIFQEFLKAS